MKITVIGCWGAYPETNEATSGYLVQHEGSSILLDCGSGVLSRLARYCPLEELDAVVLTHTHADHMADLYCLEYAILILRQIGKRTKPLDLYVYAEAAGRLALEYPEHVRVHPVETSTSLPLGSMNLTFAETVHDLPCLAVKVASRQDKTFVYSGDTGYDEALAGFAGSADLLLIESSFYDWQAGKMKWHLTAGEAGRIAALAGVRQTVLTHLPHYGSLDQLVDEASRHYSGPIRLAYGGLQINL